MSINNNTKVLMGTIDKYLDMRLIKGNTANSTPLIIVELLSRYYKYCIDKYNLNSSNKDTTSYLEKASILYNKLFDFQRSCDDVCIYRNKAYFQHPILSGIELIDLFTAPVASNVGFPTDPTVTIPITPTADYFSESNVQEGESLYKIFQYDGPSGNDGKQLLFEGSISTPWTPVSTWPNLRYVNIEYTPVDINSLAGDTVSSGRVILEPEPITDYLDDTNITAAYDFRAGLDLSDRTNNLANATLSGNVSYKNASTTGWLGALSFDGELNNYVRIDLGSEITSIRWYLVFRILGSNGTWAYFSGLASNARRQNIQMNYSVTNSQAVGIRYFDLDSNNNTGLSATFNALPLPPSIIDASYHDAFYDMYYNRQLAGRDPLATSSGFDEAPFQFLFLGTSGEGTSQYEPNPSVTSGPLVSEIALCIIAPGNHNDYDARAMRNHLLTLLP